MTEFEGYGGHIKREERVDPVPLKPFSLPTEFDSYEVGGDPAQSVGAITSYSWIRLGAVDTEEKVRHFTTRMAKLSTFLKWFEEEGLTFLAARVKDREFRAGDMEALQGLADKFEGQPA